LLVVLVTLVLLITAVLKHGWAALTPTPFWGWLGFWGAWGAAVTALELKQLYNSPGCHHHHHPIKP
jgi:hypothetical protein